MNLEVFAGTKDITLLFQKMFFTNDPIICIWSPPNMEKVNIWKEIKKNSKIDYFNIFEKDQITSLLFPSGVEADKWCLVLATIKIKPNDISPMPIYGWFLCSDCAKLSFDFDF